MRRTLTTRWRRSCCATCEQQTRQLYNKTRETFPISSKINMDTESLPLAPKKIQVKYPTPRAKNSKQKMNINTRQKMVIWFQHRLFCRLLCLRVIISEEAGRITLIRGVVRVIENRGLRQVGQLVYPPSISSSRQSGHTPPSLHTLQWSNFFCSSKQMQHRCWCFSEGIVGDRSNVRGWIRRCGPRKVFKDDSCIGCIYRRILSDVLKQAFDVPPAINLKWLNPKSKHVSEHFFGQSSMRLLHFKYIWHWSHKT